MRVGCCWRRDDLRAVAAATAASAARCGRQARSSAAAPCASLRRPWPAAAALGGYGKAGDHLEATALVGVASPGASCRCSVRKPDRGAWQGSACGDVETAEERRSPVLLLVTEHSRRSRVRDCPNTIYTYTSVTKTPITDRHRALSVLQLVLPMRARGVTDGDRAPCVAAAESGALLAADDSASALYPCRPQLRSLRAAPRFVTSPTTATP